MVESKTWVLARHFEGFPEDSNFELKLEQQPEPKDGGNKLTPVEMSSSR